MRGRTCHTVVIIRIAQHVGRTARAHSGESVGILGVANFHLIGQRTRGRDRKKQMKTNEGNNEDP